MNVERRRPRLRCRILKMNVERRRPRPAMKDFKDASGAQAPSPAVQDLKDYVVQEQTSGLWHRHSCLCRMELVKDAGVPVPHYSGGRSNQSLKCFRLSGNTSLLSART